MKRVFVDMDDVLCDFSKSYKLLKSKYEYPQSLYGFFRNLEPIQGAIDAYNLLETEYDVWILTSPSIYNPFSYSEKREWVENHLGFERCRKLILSPNKSLLMGDYLIDDNIHVGFSGEHIHFGKKYPDWNSVIEYLM
jgi:5'-nucleotidase